MKVHSCRFFFSVQQLATQRVKFQHKICFKPSNDFLKLKTTPTVALAARTFRDGNFLRMYKKFQKSYIQILLKRISKLPHNNEFKNLYNQYQSFRDFNRVLFWKIMSVNSLFSTKQLDGKRILYYLRPERRPVLILLWLKNIVHLNKKNYHNCRLELFEPVFNFISTNKSVNDIFTLKLRVYKMRLAKG